MEDKINMINPTKLPDVGLRIDSVRPNRRPATRSHATSVKGLPLRISRGNQVIGRWSVTEIEERIGREDLLLTDLFYDEDASDWVPLSKLPAKQISAKTEGPVTRLCYCGTGLPFRVCCGDGSVY
jgi:hypothetical protein